MRRAFIIIAVLGIIGIAALILLTSNLTRSYGTAQLSPGERGMNDLALTGPYGWYCIKYSKTVTSTEPDAPLGLAGKGYSRCPLFGATLTSSTDYPAQGGLDSIPLDQPTMIYRNDAGTYEVYVLFTQDLSRYERLDEE
jgi:hypothetical protein